MDRSHTETATTEKYRPSKVLAQVIPALLYALCGYLSGICALPFGAYPFGVALLAAADRNAVFVFIGLVGAAILQFESGTAAVFIGIYTVLLLLRILVRLTVDSPFRRADGKRSLSELFSTLFSEQVGYRVCAAALAAFGLSLSFLIGGGFLYYDLFGLLLSVSLAPLAAYILYGYFGTDAQSRSYRSDIGFAALAVICTYSAASLNIYGVSIAVAGGILLVLCVCRKRGFVRGLILSVALGIAYSPVMCPIFVISALCYGVFMKISTTLVAMSCLFASLGYAFYIRGIYALDGEAGGIITACLLFTVIVKLSSFEKETDAAKDARLRCGVLEEGELDSVRLFDMNRRMAAMSEGFARLSDLFEEMKLKFPRKAELKRICEQAFETSCTGCADHSRCRESGPISQEVQRLSSVLDENGSVGVGDFGGELAFRCGRLPDIIDEINYNYDVRFRRGESRECEFDFFSDDRNYSYKALSSLLGQSMERDSAEYIPDLSASALLCEPLEALDVGIFGVLVYGARRKRVYIKGKDRRVLEAACEQIVQVVLEHTGIELDAESVVVRRSGRTDEGSIELWEKKKFELSCVTQNLAASEESFCGDSLALFENSEGRFFAVLSDGMGAGRDAALMSELATGFVKNMLTFGGMNREILAMLNSFLQNRYDSSANECSATLDLMEFDEVSGRATFFKCGAAPTYVYRNDSLFKLRSRTMPLGILSETDARVLDFELNDGDVVVMMSDGVTGGKEECPYLFDLLRQNIDSAGSARTAELIMKYAKCNGSNDDITVAVMRVNRCS